MNFTLEQYKLILNAVYRYQQIYNLDNKTKDEYLEILDLLTKLIYTQDREQPT